MYTQIHRKFQETAQNSVLPSAVAGIVHNIPSLDQQWMESTAKKAALKLEKLDTDLKNYKAEALPEISEHHSKESNAAILTKLRCAAGLAELATQKYKSAAKYFLQANIDHCDFPELLSPNNIAVYGGLCALASFDRQELKKNVISNSTFKLFLELDPHLREIIHKFYESKYASCLRLLGEIRDNLLLDMYLAPHVNALYTAIRNRALTQYFSPYLSADMSKMATAFNTNV